MRLVDKAAWIVRGRRGKEKDSEFAQGFTS